mmetsp:Transcript_5087/g.12561  ORF Transcript_5087/g.12561 Transcript_5087/m.12561 type:complete len:370 (-) Transcript_5087:81-1190(-)
MQHPRRFFLKSPACIGGIEVRPAGLERLVFRPFSRRQLRAVTRSAACLPHARLPLRRSQLHDLRERPPGLPGLELHPELETELMDPACCAAPLGRGAAPAVADDLQVAVVEALLQQASGLLHHLERLTLICLGFVVEALSTQHPVLRPVTVVAGATCPAPGAAPCIVTCPDTRVPRPPVRSNSSFSRQKNLRSTAATSSILHRPIRRHGGNTASADAPRVHHRPRLIHGPADHLEAGSSSAFHREGRVLPPGGLGKFGGLDPPESAGLMQDRNGGSVLEQAHQVLAHAGEPRARHRPQVRPAVHHLRAAPRIPLRRRRAVGGEGDVLLRVPPDEVQGPVPDGGYEVPGAAVVQLLQGGLSLRRGPGNSQ